MANRKRKKYVQTLTNSLTGDLSQKNYLFSVMPFVRQWCDELAPGDMIAVRCESALPDKQYAVWGKWFSRKETKHGWKANPELKCFTFYKQRNVEC
jgi:hypothetical protein